MAVFISAGHNPKGIKTDSGAVANGYVEAEQMVIFRDLVLKHYKSMINSSYKVISDNDDETLKQYLDRIQTGEGSVVIEFHLDAFPSPETSGISVWVGDEADKMDLAFAKELTEIGAKVLGIKNRGIHPEKESFHKKLGLMRENGIVCLVEICPITNKSDMQKFQENKFTLAYKFAQVIKKYEDMIK